MKEAKQFLIQTLTERTTVNPSYSMRAFARDLEMSPQQLSNFLNGRRGISTTTAANIVQKLSLKDYEKEIFLESLKSTFSRSQTQKTIAKAKLKSLKATSELKSLEDDVFKVISIWHHFALMELIKIAKPKHSLEWFSKKLNVSVLEVESAIKRLENLQLIKKSKTRWETNQEVVIADYDIPSEAIRSYHRQILEKANKALTFQGPEERYGSSSTVPIKVKDLARAKKLIQDFRLAFDEEISSSTDGEEVYALSVQFFRLTEQ